MQKLILVMLLILTASCGKAPSLPNPNQGKTVSPLVGKSNEEILALKYNNQLDLKCEVRVQKGGKVDLNKEPTDQFVWNVPGELSLLRVLNYKIGKKETILVVRLSKLLEFHDSLTHVNERKQEFYLQHTPVLTIAYRRAAKSILSNGSVHELDTFSNKPIFENVESRLFTMTSEVNNEFVTEDVRCSLVTKINPDYQDQWVRVK